MKMSDDIGQWYEDKRKLAETIQNKIEKLKVELNINCLCPYAHCQHYKGQKLELLYRQLEMARYVGD